MERKYISQYGALFHNFAYRETSTVFVLQQTVEPSAELVPGRHGVDAKAEGSNLQAIELKSVNQPAAVFLTKDGSKYNGHLGNGHRLDHSNLVGKFDKMQSEERFARVKAYDGFAFSIFSNRHLPEVVFYVKSPTGVQKIQNLIEQQRQNLLVHTDTSSFKATTLDIKYSDVFQQLTEDELIILVDHTYVDHTNDYIQYTQISKEDYNKYLIGSEMPKGNFRRK